MTETEEELIEQWGEDRTHPHNIKSKSRHWFLAFSAQMTSVYKHSLLPAALVFLDGRKTQQFAALTGPSRVVFYQISSRLGCLLTV